MGENLLDLDDDGLYELLSSQEGVVQYLRALSKADMNRPEREENLLRFKEIRQLVSADKAEFKEGKSSASVTGST